MTGLIILAVIGLVLLLAWRYDRRQHRRGHVVRGSRAMTGEATHSRIDIDAVPYEPVRQAGQRDWATYRARDRKRD